MSDSILDRQVIETVTASIAEAIKARLQQGYNEAPLNKLIDSVVKSREGELRKLIEGAIDAALGGEFREALHQAVVHKLARVLVSKMEGEVEKRANEIRTSPEARAKITLAISEALKTL